MPIAQRYVNFERFPARRYRDRGGGEALVVVSLGLSVEAGLPEAADELAAGHGPNG
jgi:hypothetical protein